MLIPNSLHNCLVKDTPLCGLMLVPLLRLLTITAYPGIDKQSSGILSHHIGSVRLSELHLTLVYQLV